MKSTRYYSDEQEKQIQKLLGGRITSNSGGTKFGGGDVLTDSFLIEAKTTTTKKGSFSIKNEWLLKAKEQAFEQGKDHYSLAFQFEPGGCNYFIIDENSMKEYLELLKEKKDEVR